MDFIKDALDHYDRQTGILTEKVGSHVQMVPKMNYLSSVTSEVDSDVVHVLRRNAVHHYR